MTTPTVTEHIIRAVAAAISRAEIHDDRMTSDPNRIRAWAEAAAHYGTDDTAIACRAVDTHYTAPGAPTIRVGDFIAHYRAIRGANAEREKGQQIAAGAIAAPDPLLGGLPIGAVDGKPIWHAYEHAYNAHRYPCDSCHAEANQACINPINQRTRKIPCRSRVLAGMAADDGYCQTCNCTPDPTDDQD